MKKILTFDAVFSKLLATLGQPKEERLAWVEQFQRQRSKSRDALAQSEVVILQAIVDQDTRPIYRMIEQLEKAVRVFSANDLPERAALCWLFLAKWNVLRGETAESLSCSYRALAIAEIDMHTRLSLTNTVLPCLALLLRIDEAMLCLRRDFLPFMGAASPSPTLAVAWTDAAFIHVLTAIRNGKLQGILTLNMQDTTALCTDEARQLMRPHLEEGKRCLSRALAACEAAVAEPHARIQGLILALEGRCDAAFRSFGLKPKPGIHEPARRYTMGWTMRINGRWPEAVTHLQACLRLAVEHDYVQYERAAQYELSLCHAKLGDLHAAFEALSRFSLLQARAMFQGTPTSAELDEWRHPPGRAAGVDRDGHADLATAVHLRRAVPPYVARARRLFKETIAKRLTLNEMATRVGIGPRSLQTGLREHLGTTFVAAYRYASMHEARQLLQLSSLSIREIATRVGYESATTFARDYKAFSDLSPTAFRAAAALSASQSAVDTPDAASQRNAQ